MIEWIAINYEPILVTSDESIFTALQGVNYFPGYIWCWLSHKMMENILQLMTYWYT